jgi:hypothetical protein
MTRRTPRPKLLNRVMSGGDMAGNTVVHLQLLRHTTIVDDHSKEGH